MTSQAKLIFISHQNTKLGTQIERFSATEQEKYDNNVIIFNIYDPLKIGL